MRDDDRQFAARLAVTFLVIAYVGLACIIMSMTVINFVRWYKVEVGLNSNGQ